jgi:hypothetical protein
LSQDSETYLGNPEPLLVVIHRSPVATQAGSQMGRGLVILAGFATGAGSVIRAEYACVGAATGYSSFELVQDKSHKDTVGTLPHVPKSENLLSHLSPSRSRLAQHLNDYLM